MRISDWSSDVCSSDVLFRSEVTPATARASWTFWSSLVGQAGLFASAVAAYLLLPTYSWRWMFAIPGISCLLLFILSRAMPESPRWLAGKGRDAEADAIVTTFEGDNRGVISSERDRKWV